MNDRLLTLLLNQSWQILLLALIVAVASKFIAKNRPHLAHAMWILVLIKCVTPPIWSSSFGVFSQLQTLVNDETENATPASEPSEFLPEIPLRAANMEPLIVETFQGVEPAIDPLPEFGESSSPQAEITLAEEPTPDASIEFAAATPPIEESITTVVEIEIGPSPWPQRLLIFVAVGAMLTLLIIVVRCVRCLRLIRRHRTTEFDDALNERLRQLAKQLRIRRVPRIVVSNVLFGPAVLGLLRHTIVLPRCLLGNELVPRLLPPVSALEAGASGQCVPKLEPWNEEVPLGKRDLQFLDPILAHELLHIRRGDLRFGMLQVIAQSLWWFHPAVWFANRWLSREAERCCDEQVIAELGCSPGQYARSLLAVIESKHTLQPIPVFPGMKPVEITTQRMERIMSLKTGLNKRTPLWCWLAMAVLAIVVLPGAVAKSLPEETVAEPITDKSEPKQTIEDRGSTNTLKSLIANRQFAGNVFWRDRSLREHLVREKSFWYLLAEVFTADTIPTETKALTEYYRNVGFFDAKVTGKAFFSRDRSEASLAYTITEGVRYKIREIRFEGNKRITTADLEAELSLKPGDVYDATDVARDFKKLVTLLGPEVGLNPVPHFIEQPGVVDLVFEVDESPQGSNSEDDQSKTSGTSATPPQEALRVQSYGVTDLIEQLSKDQNVPADLARQLLVGYIKSAATAVFETPKAPPVARNAEPLESVPLPQPALQLAQNQPEPTERKPLERPKLKELSSIALEGNQLVVLHTKEGQQQVQNSINQFRQFGFQQFLVSVQFISGSAENLKNLIAELPDSHVVDNSPAADFSGVLTAAESDKILARVKESDTARLESAPSVVAFNGQMAEIFNGVERPFVVGFEKDEPKLRLVKNGMTLSIESTFLDNGLLRLSCVAQSDDVTSVDVVSAKRPAVSATPSQYQMPRVTSKRIQTAVELKAGQNLLINGLSTYVAKDNSTSPVMVLLKVREYVHTSPTASIRLSDDYIPNSDMELNADSVVAFVGEKPITVDDVIGTPVWIRTQEDQKHLTDQQRRNVMTYINQQLPSYLYGEAVLESFKNDIPAAQHAEITDRSSLGSPQILRKIYIDNGLTNDADREKFTVTLGSNAAKMQTSLIRKQQIEYHLQTLPQGSPLRDKERILTHCKNLLLDARLRKRVTLDFNSVTINDVLRRVATEQGVNIATKNYLAAESA